MGQPFEKGLHRGQQAMLGADGERLSVTLSVVVEMTLIALQDRLRYLLGFIERPFITPLNESSEGGISPVDGIPAISFDV